MNPNWTDFEKYVFEKFEKLDRELGALKVRVAVWSAVGGAIMALAGEVVAKVWAHTQ